MGYRVSDKNVYWIDDEGKSYGVNITAVDKVVTHREIESVTITVGSEAECPTTAVGATVSDIIAKFNLSEENPVSFDKSLEQAGVDKVSPATTTVKYTGESGAYTFTPDLKTIAISTRNVTHPNAVSVTLADESSEYSTLALIGSPTGSGDSYSVDVSFDAFYEGEMPETLTLNVTVGEDTKTVKITFSEQD